MRKLKKFLKKNKSGFTLIELVVYMGILTILLGVLGSIFTEIVNVQLSSKSTSSVNQDGRYLLSKLLYDVKSSSNIVTPATPGTQTNTMKITINSIDYTYSVDSNSNLQVSYGVNQKDVLNSYDTSLSNVTFTRIGNGGSTDTVRVSFTLTSRTRDKQGQQPDSQSFATTLGNQ